MIFQTVRSAALAALAVTAVFAQSPTPPTPPTPAQQATQLVNRLTTLLDLTTTQQTAATTIFTTEFTTLGDAAAPVFRPRRKAFTTAVESNSLSAINTVAAQIANLTQQQVVAQGTANADFYAQLSSTQQTKYTTLNLGGGRTRIRRIRPRTWRPGPGGPGGPPPRATKYSRYPARRPVEIRQS